MKITCMPERIYPQGLASEVIVADAILTEAPYFADATGKTDITALLNRALSDLADNGGGTLYLPRGRYLVSGCVYVPSYCALVGDFGDACSDYGTLILATPPSVDAPLPALFDLGGSGGVMGVTVYYPEQSLDAVKPYPFTFYNNGMGDHYMLPTVKSCRVLNGYRILGGCVAEGNAHEQFTVDGLYATALHLGAEVYNQADVGTWNHVTVSPRFWLEAGEAFGAPDQDALIAYTEAHTVGLMLGDLEWTEFSFLTVEHCRIGMQIVKGKRIEFAGSVFRASITRCRTALRVDSIDERWGMVLAASRLQGDIALSHNARGAVKLTDCILDGAVTGEGEVIYGEGRIPEHLLASPPAPSVPAPADHLRILPPTEGDCAEALQRLLDELAPTGGVVYLPAGIYRLESPISVPAGVTLLGAALPVRGQGGQMKGVMLLTDHSGAASDPASLPALITLTGRGASVRGIQIIWDKNGPGNLHQTPRAIRGQAEAVSAINCCIVGASFGIDFGGCDRHFIKKVTLCCYENAILAGGEGGVIEGCLQNGSVLTRTALPDPVGWVAEHTIFQTLFPITRMGILPGDSGSVARARPSDNGIPLPEADQGPENRRGCIFLILKGAVNQTVYNTFAYGVGSLVRAEDSKGVFLCNLGADNIAHPQMIYQGSEALALNIMRYNGTSFEASDSDITLLNRIAILDKHEENRMHLCDFPACSRKGTL